ncbi:MAG: hypothetical protein HY296_01720 [Thaumarchaeota archaeon]|nr:hypothetical protein [Nitrososphaerota archaeon]
MHAPKTTVIGSYPIVASEAEVQHYELKRTAEPGMESIFSPFLKTAERAFKDQISAGIEVPSTGQTSYDYLNLFLDPVKVAGVASNGSGRKVSGDLRRLEPLRLEEVRYVYELIDSVQLDGRKERLLELKEPITDPYTLATGVQNETGKDTRELTFDILKNIVIPEAKSMEPYVDFYQFDAPRYSTISARPDYLRRIFEELKTELDKPIVLHVCGDTSRIFEELVKFPVDILSLDFTLTPKLIEVASRISYDQTLGVGIAKTEPRVESVGEMKALLEDVRKKLGEDRLHFVHPACGQRNLPLGAAYQKDVNITLARDEVFYGEGRVPSELAVRAEKLRPSGYDPQGKFRILVDRDSGQIVVTLVDYGNVPLRSIRGNYAERILHKIIREGMFQSNQSGTMHLVYVALELAKAEAALHNAIQYRQDQPLIL